MILSGTTESSPLALFLFSESLARRTSSTEKKPSVVIPEDRSKSTQKVGLILDRPVHILRMGLKRGLSNTHGLSGKRFRVHCTIGLGISLQIWHGRMRSANVLGAPSPSSQVSENSSTRRHQALCGDDMSTGPHLLQRSSTPLRADARDAQASAESLFQRARCEPAHLPTRLRWHGRGTCRGKCR